MNVRILALFGTLALVGTVSPAWADDAEDQVFAAGQFTGASTFCGVPRPDANALAKAMLDAFGVDSSGPSPAMAKFTEGVASGVREQRDTPQASCDEVKSGFAQMKSHFE